MLGTERLATTSMPQVLIFTSMQGVNLKRGVYVVFMASPLGSAQARVSRVFSAVSPGSKRLFPGVLLAQMSPTGVRCNQDLKLILH